MTAQKDNWNINTRRSELALKFETTDARHAYVEHHTAMSEPAFLISPELTCGGKQFGPQTYGFEQCRNGCAYCFVVINYENCGFGEHYALALAVRGRVKWNVAPQLAFAVAHSRPPCASTIERLMDSPSPIPSLFVVKKASKR